MDKEFGCSLIEVNDEAHEFVAGERRECDGEDKMQEWTWRDERRKERGGYVGSG